MCQVNHWQVLKILIIIWDSSGDLYKLQSSFFPLHRWVCFFMKSTMFKFQVSRSITMDTVCANSFQRGSCVGKRQKRQKQMQQSIHCYKKPKKKHFFILKTIGFSTTASIECNANVIWNRPRRILLMSIRLYCSKSFLTMFTVIQNKHI